MKPIFLFLLLIFLCPVSFFIYPAEESVRNITALSYESRSNGLDIWFLEDSLILPLYGNNSLLLRLLLKKYPESLMLDCEGGVVVLWPEGAYSQFSYQIGFPVQGVGEEEFSFTHSLYCDWSREWARALLTGGLRGYLGENGPSGLFFLGYKRYWGPFSFWVRDTLSYGVLPGWGDSLWLEVEWTVLDWWRLKVGSTFGTSKSETDPELLGMEYALLAGTQLLAGPAVFSYNFNLMKTPGLFAQTHALVLDLKL